MRIGMMGASTERRNVDAKRRAYERELMHEGAKAFVKSVYEGVMEELVRDGCIDSSVDDVRYIEDEAVKA